MSNSNRSEDVEYPSPAEIRRRIDAYLASPRLTADDRDYVATWLSIHCEVAEAVPDAEPPRGDRLMVPTTILGRARLVSQLHRETELLAPGLPSLVADLRDLAELLAQDVRWLVRS